MKKKACIATAIVILFVILYLSFSLYHISKNDPLEAMCISSVNAALEHFKKYDTNKEESEYLSGVAEFRTYMTAYLCLKDGKSNTDYIWCNTLYGDMILNPDKVKAHTSELIAALYYLTEDYDHPNGFDLINSLNNLLRFE